MDTRAPPTTARIFWVFLGVAARSFGGAAPWARKALVEEHRWLSGAEFDETLALCQIIPGPNVVNLAVFLGDRWRGVRGALAAFAGLMLAPSALAIVLEIVLLRSAHMGQLQRALVGLGAGAAGLIAEMALKMAKGLEPSAVPVLLAGLAFLGAGPLRLPLPWVVAGLAPLGLAWTSRRPR